MTLPQWGFNALWNVPQTCVTGSSGNIANATAAASLPAVANKTNYIVGLDVTGSGATAGLPVQVPVTGAASGTMTYTYSAAAGVLVENVPLSIQFQYPIPATATNQAITVSCPALGAGNTSNNVNVYGFVI